MLDNALLRSGIAGLALASAATCGFAEGRSVIPQAISAEDYARGERFLPWNASKYVGNGEVSHRWIHGTDRLWYLYRTADAKEFIVVDARTGKSAAAFDHEAIARALSRALNRSIDPRQLPFDTIELHERDGAIRFEVESRKWVCSRTAECAASDTQPFRTGELRSPDGKWAAFLKGDDLWLRSLGSGEERPLTTDGEPHYAYGRPAESSLDVVTQQRKGNAPRLEAIWSPDSKKLLTHRLDEREVSDLYYLQSVPEDGTVRPQLRAVRFALPGDEHVAATRLIVFDIAARSRTDMKMSPLPVTAWTQIADGRVWWSNDSATVYALPREIGQKRLRLSAMSATSGESRLLMEEVAPTTYLEPGGFAMRLPDVRVLSTGEILWYSERDDWGHLYLYDSRGRLKNRVTSGAWKVLRIVRVDESRRRVFFLGVGRERGEDPYQRHLYAVNLDGSDLKALTPENADHDVKISAPAFFARSRDSSVDPEQGGFSPSGRYFVDTYSRPDLPPRTVLRDGEGRTVAVLADADISALRAGGLAFPEPFSVLAADGKTRIYGNLLRPSRFDASRKYAVIDAVYPGPQGIRTPKTFMGSVFDWNFAQSLAELGFVVVTLDGRGTPLRSKSFHDFSYGKMQDAGGLEDHVAGLRELAASRPYMDMNRTGVYGHSGGGYAAARAILAYPDFYKVAIASAGNHDQRGYTLMWGPTYQGPYDQKVWAPQINATLANRLEGKLLLIHGDMDDNVHPALTMQLANALIKANKDFDLLILPNANHEVSGSIGYFARRHWDYFVRNLMGATPPAGYRVTEPR